MRRNLIAVILYPFVFWVLFITESFLMTTLGSHLVPQVVSQILLILPFVIPSIVSGWIVNSRPILFAIIGSLLHQTLVFILAPNLMRLLFSSTDSELQRILVSSPQVDIHLAVATLQVLSIISLPLVVVLAGLGGILGAKLRKLRFQPN